MGKVTEQIADYIIKTVQEESILSGFQYQVSYEGLEKKFNVPINEPLIGEIEEALNKREEVADVDLVDDSFDVVIYTDFAPNYEPSDYEDED